MTGLTPEGAKQYMHNELLRHTDAMDFAASNERFGQWVGTEDVLFLYVDDGAFPFARERR
jgi:hypothetical protein